MKSTSRTFKFKGAEGGHEFTGERYLPGVGGPIQYEHFHRYLFSTTLCQGKEVLDIASGEGYGSAVLAQSAKQVIGVDIDEQAVNKARARYAEQTNLRFLHGSATAIPLPDASVDVLNSFETLEHFTEHEAFMTEARRVLRPDGLMIISTPNRPVYSPPGAPPNEFHVRELDRGEFIAWLQSGFKNFVLYEQKPTAGSMLFREGREGAKQVTYWSEVAPNEYRATAGIVDPVYFVALASDGPLPEPDDDVLEGALSFARYDDARNQQIGAQLTEITRLTTETLGRGEEIGTLTAETVRLTEAVLERDAKVGSLTVETVRLNEEIVRLNEEIVGISASGAERDARVGELTAETVRLEEEIARLNQECSRLNDQLGTAKELNHRLSDQSNVISLLNGIGEQVRQSHSVLDQVQDGVRQSRAYVQIEAVLRGENEALKTQIAAIYASTSWWITKPLRFAVRKLRGVRRGVAATRSPAAHQPAPPVPAASAAPVEASAAAAAAPVVTTAPAATAQTRALATVRPFVAHRNPRATVVILHSGDERALHQCLAALSEHGDEVPVRVVVVGAQASAVAKQFNVDVLGDTRAVASLEALRDVLGAPEGDYVVLLSDLLIAQAGWLDALVQGFARFGDAAAFAALVIDEQGVVRSAGAAIEADGRLKPNGVGLTAESPLVNAVTRVSSAGPGFVAIRTRTWQQIAADFGAETPFGAGLAGIALRIAELGEHIYCHPFARFVSLEQTVEREPNADEKWNDAYQRWALRERFETTFVSAGANGGPLTLAKRPKVVLIDAFVPKPDQDSGSADVFWYMRIFQEFGFEVSFIAAFEDKPVESYSDALRRWGVRVQYARGLESLNRLVMTEAAQADVVLAQRVIVARHVIEPLKVGAPHVKVVFGTVDLHYLREERAAIHERSAEALDLALSLRREEISAISKSDATIVVSRLEYEIVKRTLPAANVHRIPIPRLPTRSEKTFSDRSGVIFVGGFAHRPNVDAVTFLVNDIWPKVIARLPHAKLDIVGSNVTPEVQALHDPARGVTIVGFVENLDGVLERARLSVAPLRFGAGIKGKVVSSLLHGLPCVLSRVASEGMGLVNEEHVLEGDDAEEIANAIIRLHEDEALWNRLADAGFAAAMAEYSVESVAAKMASLLGSIGSSGTSHKLRANAFNVLA
ncbi:methyltransferase domain-containing protein [Caballeronia sp. ATUFL_M2_KS44]|uniref:methyltransferase domain-containing protein n=1 Tax=Caballeronia sp. ATUFL_M2_KS44 TaxID=2921767 RepID=UPI0020293466|nr:methyltransferase domain-containing protein [Caballeronia sp. ATUFL_M2_KS44]